MSYKGLRKWICGHKNLTDVVDDHGYAICRDCGCAVPVKLTRYQLDKAFERFNDKT